ncbi:MAG TPA: hypothetical protein VGI88_12665 [Verrucomicrobiae bacterium]|jgi:hypothetical protein
MKRCPYCGKEYSDEYSVCAIDENPLASCDPKPLTQSSEPVESEEPDPPPPDYSVDFSWKAVAAAGSKVITPEGFGFLGTFGSFNAKRLLDKFAKAGIRFQLRKIPKRRVFVSAEYAEYDTQKEIQIFVYKYDEEAAAQIYTADWRV